MGLGYTIENEESYLPASAHTRQANNSRFTRVLAYFSRPNGSLLSQPRAIALGLGAKIHSALQGRP